MYQTFEIPQFPDIQYSEKSEVPMCFVFRYSEVLEELEEQCYLSKFLGLPDEFVEYERRNMSFSKVKPKSLIKNLKNLNSYPDILYSTSARHTAVAYSLVKATFVAISKSIIKDDPIKFVLILALYKLLTETSIGRFAIRLRRYFRNSVIDNLNTMQGSCSGPFETYLLKNVDKWTCQIREIEDEIQSNQEN